jgi:hypothetical protein
MPMTTDETSRTRKSINELADTFERSGEKLSNQLNSAFLAWVEAGTDVMVSAVRLAADIAEAGAERLTDGILHRTSQPMGATSTAADPTSPTSRMMKAQRDTLAQAVRLHTQALKSSVNVAQSAADRLVDRTEQATAQATETV